MRTGPIADAIVQASGDIVRPGQLQMRLFRPIADAIVQAYCRRDKTGYDDSARKAINDMISRTNEKQSQREIACLVATVDSR